MFFEHYHYLILEYPHQPTKAVPIEKSLAIPLPLQHLATTNLLSVPKDLSVPDISYEYNHSICGLLCLPSFAAGRGTLSRAQNRALV